MIFDNIDDDVNLMSLQSTKNKLLKITIIVENDYKKNEEK